VKWGISMGAEYSVDALLYRCAMWSHGDSVAWRYRLYFSMLLLVDSVARGRDSSVHSILEVSTMQNNLRIISDMESFFWTVLFRIASLVF